MSGSERVVLVPFDNDAMEAMMLCVDYMHRCSQYCIPADHYDALLKSGFFRVLNQRLDILIDEYESEVIVGRNRLIIALQCLEEVVSNYDKPDHNTFAIMRAFILLAFDCETCVGFFF